MTIGLFNESFPPVVDGVSICVENYAQHLSELGHNVFVVTPETYNNESENTPPLPYTLVRYPSLPVPFRKPYRFGTNLFSLTKLRELGKSEIALAHAHCPFSSGKLAKNLATRKKIPFVATFHSKFRYDFERVIPNRAIVDLIIKNIVSFFEEADEVWVPQEGVLETLYQYGYKGKQPVIMPNGDDLASRNDAKELRNELRNELGIPPQLPLFLFVGQQIREKNIPFILHSLQQLGSFPYKMISIGEGYGLQEFREQAKTLGIADKVDFIGPIFDRNRLAAYYAAADLFLFPSYYDTWGLVFREAAAMETPSLLIANSTAAAAIKDGYNGYIANESPLDYANKIRLILQDAQKLSETGLMAKRTLSESWKQVVKQVNERYQMLIEKYSAEKK